MAATPFEEFSSESLEALSYPTPFFFFSKKRIVEKLNEYKELFPGASIHYAIKANFEPEVLQTLVDAGSCFEVASMHELDFLKAVKADSKKIIYGTSVKPAEHIKAFAEYGVDRFSCDSLPELQKIASVAPGSRVYIRVRVNDTGSVFRFSEKFGTSKENAVALLKHAKELGLIPYGMSFHVGSQASNPMAWAEAVEHLRDSIIELSEMGIQLEALNIGGGYPCKYASSENVPDLSEIAHHFYEEYNKLPYKPQILLEPGRGIIAETGVAVATVIGRVERGENTWLFLDMGVYNGLFEVMAYQGSTRYSITSMRHSYEAGEMLFSIAGPTGDSPDVITREALLPQDIDVGDKLILHATGAYSLVATSPFNGFPKPDVYFL